MKILPTFFVGTPGASAIVDNQGDLELCTRSAIAKAVVDGFDKDTWKVGRCLDFQQASVYCTLCNEHKDGSGKWPDKFHHKEYQLNEVTDNTYYIVSLDVTKVDKTHFTSDITSPKPEYKYVLVYDMGMGITWKKNLHCVYVKSLENNVIKCMNSHGDKNPEPEISVDQAGNILYSIQCTAKKMVSASQSTKKTSSALLKLVDQSSMIMLPASSTSNEMDGCKENLLQKLLEKSKRIMLAASEITTNTSSSPMLILVEQSSRIMCPASQMANNKPSVPKTLTKVVGKNKANLMLKQQRRRDVEST